MEGVLGGAHGPKDIVHKGYDKATDRIDRAKEGAKEAAAKVKHGAYEIAQGMQEKDTQANILLPSSICLTRPFAPNLLLRTHLHRSCDGFLPSPEDVSAAPGFLFVGCSAGWIKHVHSYSNIVENWVFLGAGHNPLNLTLGCHCKLIVCLKDQYIESTSFSFYKCKCNTGWQSLFGAFWLPSIFPNCSIDLTYANKSVAAPLAPSIVAPSFSGVLDVCTLHVCGVDSVFVIAV
ncbi:hypothetical protein L7F22_039694 [Adiantum nelumboides]|nr:hypothetical protein [Adiantum nelumboides]